MERKGDIQSFLNKLSELELDEEKLFEVKELKDIEKTPCEKSRLKVIDFDKAKDKLVAHYSLHTLSSCDCLKLDDNEIIDFIELKSISKMLKFNPIYKENKEELKTKLSEFNISSKIIDSYNLLRRLLEDKNTGFLDSDRDIFDNIRKRYFIVFDLDAIQNSKEFIFNSFKFLGIKNTIEETIREQVRGADLINISEPMLKTCKTISEVYQ